jgi:hypothetical protein
VGEAQSLGKVTIDRPLATACSVFAKLREIRSGDESHEGPKDEPAGPAVDHQHALRGSYILLNLCGLIQLDTFPSMASGPDSVALAESPTVPPDSAQPTQRLLQSLQGRVSALAASRDELALAGQVRRVVTCA